MVRLLFAVMFTVTVHACAVQTARDAPLAAFSVGEDERQMGVVARQRIAQEVRLYKDVEFQRYLDSVARKVLAAVPHGEEKLTFSLIDEDGFAAHVLPDGHILITRGMLGLLSSEAQLAAVLAHELGHLINHHALQKLHKAQQTEALAKRIGERLDSNYGKQLSSTFARAIARGYSREAEAEADRVAVEILHRAGYPPVAMLEVLELLRRTDVLEKELVEIGDLPKGRVRGAFATHPATERRIQSVTALLRKYPSSRQSFANTGMGYLGTIDGMEIARYTGGPFRDGNRVHHPAWQASFALEVGERFYRASDELLFVYEPTQSNWSLRLKRFALEEAPGLDAYLDRYYPKARRMGVKDVDRGVSLVELERRDSSSVGQVFAWATLKTTSHALVVEAGDAQRLKRLLASYSGIDNHDPDIKRAHYVHVVSADLARSIANANEGVVGLSLMEWLINLEFDLSKSGDTPVKLLE